MAVRFETSYASNRGITVSYTISNSSQVAHKFIRANDTFDVSIQLLSPDGKPVTAFRDMPGATVHRQNLKRFFVDDLAPGAQFEGSLDLAIEYPFQTVGEYRCVLTRRVYRSDPSIVPKGPHDPPGIGVELVSPEFRFQIAAIDPSYKSPLADAVPKLADAEPSTSAASSPAKPLPPSVKPSPVPKVPEAKPAPTPGEEPTSSTPWSVVAVLIIAVIGLLWLVLKKRK